MRPLYAPVSTGQRRRRLLLAVSAPWLGSLGDARENGIDSFLREGGLPSSIGALDEKLAFLQGIHQRLSLVRCHAQGVHKELSRSETIGSSGDGCSLQLVVSNLDDFVVLGRG
ncbi:hypothetical protein ACFQ60_03865 [Streptomyces zhihengii]